jgi:hypothetical protein
MSETLIKNKLDSAKFNDAHNGHEWTPELDEALKKSVLNNYFNFNIISLEINDEAHRLAVKFGIANAYTNEKCRIRWFYLHCTRALEGKKKEKEQKKSKAKTVAANKENAVPSLSAVNPNIFTEKEFKEDSKEAGTIPFASTLKIKTTATIEPKRLKNFRSEENTVPLDTVESNQIVESNFTVESDPKEESKVDIAQQEKRSVNARDLWEQKEIREDKKESQTYEDAEKYQWRQNIIPARNNRDYLDVSNENFSTYKTIDIQGNEVSPSTFNIFRDSFKKTFTEMRDTLKMNLPELNIENTSESDDNEEVVPLDFRTKLMDGTGDVVMQAKPLKIYNSADEDGDEELIGDLIKKSKMSPESKILNMTAADYLREHRKEAFNDDDEDVILIQPNINIKEKLMEIDLD